MESVTDEAESALLREQIVSVEKVSSISTVDFEIEDGSKLESSMATFSQMKLEVPSNMKLTIWKRFPLFFSFH